MGLEDLNFGSLACRYSHTVVFNCFKASSVEELLCEDFLLVFLLLLLSQRHLHCLLCRVLFHKNDLIFLTFNHSSKLNIFVGTDVCSVALAPLLGLFAGLSVLEHETNLELVPEWTTCTHSHFDSIPHLQDFLELFCRPRDFMGLNLTPPAILLTFLPANLIVLLM